MSSIPPEITKTRRIKRIDPISVAKIAGILYATIGLICIPFAILFAITSVFAENAEHTIVMLGASIGMAIFAPVFYGAIGFVMSLLVTMLNNFIASKVGGIQIELE